VQWPCDRFFEESLEVIFRLSFPSSPTAVMNNAKKAKNQSGNSPRPSNPAALPGWSPLVPSLKRWTVLGLCLVLAGGGTWALFEFVIWNEIPSELAGKWVVLEGPDEGATVDFYRKGSMVATQNHEGIVHIIDAKVRLEGKMLHVTTRHQTTGAEATRVQTITTLEANRLVMEDGRGNSIKLERAK
jgi:uncharacterized protein (TIGR03066 family)